MRKKTITDEMFGLKIGDRIRLDFTSDPYTKLQLGQFGKVTAFWTDDLGIWRIDVKWDDGSNLSLLAGKDVYSKVEPTDEQNLIS